MFEGSRISDEEFLVHVRRLLKDNEDISVIGVRPSDKYGISPDYTLRCFNITLNTILDEALAYAKQLNAEGYNVYLGIPGLKNREHFLQELRFIIIYIDVNYEIIDKLQALKRVEEINSTEFNDSADILDDGEGFWLLMKIPFQHFDDETQYRKFINKFRNYLVNLGIKWNITIKDRFSFEVDIRVSSPDFTMAAAGMVNHNLIHPYRVKWIRNSDLISEMRVISDINEMKIPLVEMKTTNCIFTEDTIIKYGSLIRINPDFGVESFVNYIGRKKNKHKKILGPIAFGNDSSSPDYDWELIKFLRGNFKAGPGVIQHIVLINKNVNEMAKRLSDKELWFHILGLILKADKFVSTMRTDKPFDRQIKGDDKISNIRSILPGPFRLPLPGEIIKNLVLKYSPEIHFAQRGIYLLRFLNAVPEDLYLKHPTTNRVSHYLGFLCYFIFQADKPVQNKGRLLIPHRIADKFSKDLQQLKTGSIIAIYFWHYAMKYTITSIPDGLIGNVELSLHEILSWLFENKTEIFKLWKKHGLDRDRKGNQHLNNDFTDNAYLDKALNPKDA
jgi:hypothetical protein